MASYPTLVLAALVAFAVAANAQLPIPPPPPPPPGSPAAMAMMMKMQKKLTKKMMKAMKEGMEYYPVDGEDDRCNRVPDDVMKGMPMMEGCMDKSEGDMQCVCMKKPPAIIEMMETMGLDTSKVNRRTGYANVCGECVDPCALKWKPNMDDMMMDSMEMTADSLAALMGLDMADMDPDMKDLSDVPRTVRAMLNTALDILEKRMGMKNDVDAERK